MEQPNTAAEKYKWDYLLEDSFARKQLEWVRDGGHQGNNDHKKFADSIRCLGILSHAGFTKCTKMDDVGVHWAITEAGRAALERTKPKPEKKPPMSKPDLFVKILRDAKKCGGRIETMRHSTADRACQEMVEMGWMQWGDQSSFDPVFTITDKGLSHLEVIDRVDTKIDAIERSMDKATAAKIAEMSQPYDPSEHKLSKDELHILRHALGQTSQGSSSHRNHYCQDDTDSEDYRVCQSLVRKGLMFEGRKVSDIPDQVFHVTQEGKKVVADSWVTPKKPYDAETMAKQKADLSSRWRGLGDEFSKHDSEPTITLPKALLTEILQATVKGKAYAKHSLKVLGDDSELNNAFRDLIQKDIDSIEKALQAGLEAIKPKS